LFAGAVAFAGYSGRVKLTVYASFEPALLQRVLDHWNGRVPLFKAVEVFGPSRLGWGLSSEAPADEVRVFAFDGAGVEQAAAMPRAQPLIFLCPGAEGAQLPGELIDAAAAARAAGVEQLLDPESQSAAGVPYTDAFYLVLGTVIFRRARARLAPELKAIAVDCDGTLWQGLCAEDGPDGVSVGPEELALHAYLLAQKQAGRILVLVSKNVPADVEAVFERRRDLGLSLTDVAAVRAGWESKAVVLQRLSRELKLLPGSFLFIDDSPAECAEVSAALPDVAVLRRPPAGVRSLLQALWPLDLKSAEAGLGEARTKLYQDEEKRHAAQRAAPSFAEYVQSLELRVELSPATASDEARVFELTQRTNQFNTRGDRPSAESVRTAIGAGQVLVARVADRFGDYGLTGVLFLAPAGETLRVERLLLSCRVLGRGVEEEIFDGLAAYARSGFATLLVAVSVTPRNQPARAFFERAAAWSGSYGGDAYRFKLAGLGRCPRQLDKSVDEPAQGSARAIDWNAVAELTRDPSKLAAELGLAVDHEAGGDGVLAVAGEVLGCRVSRGDNLYALGADSLRMVRIVARLRSRLGIEVPIAELLYRGDVADLISLASRGVREPEDDVAFLSQLDSLYDKDEPSA
jgi:FkbH-like protein